MQVNGPTLEPVPPVLDVRDDKAGCLWWNRTRGLDRIVMRQIVVHHVSQARGALAAAKEAGVAIELRSAPDAAAYAGVGYLKALGDALGHEILIDCGEDAGLAMAALRIGCRKLAFSGPAGIGQRLREMAEQVGARLDLEAVPPEALFLEPDADAASACQAWLATRAGP